MKADSLQMGKVFSSGGTVQYVLPHFQREYAWEKDNWLTLINDIFSVYEVYNEDDMPEHFMGALVVINDGVRNGTIPIFCLVDGQQRLTTFSLLLCSLHRLVQQSHPQLAKKIFRLLTNEDEEGVLRFKLLPTIKYEDQTSYIRLIEGKSISNDVESRIPGAFNFLYKELETRLQQGKYDPERLFVVLTMCLQIVFINLDRDERPYEIFESLNFKGKPLTQADLIRNYIAMKLPEKKQTTVFRDYWSEIENLLQEKRIVGRSGLGELTAFLRHYLAYQMGALCNENHVYSRFRDRGKNMTTDEFIEEIKKLHQFAHYYDKLLRPEHEPHPKAQELLKHLNILEISTAYPFLLNVYDLLDKKQLTNEDFLATLEILENYFIRRYLTKESSNYLNKVFPTLLRELDLNQWANSLKRALLSKKFPTDYRVRQAVENVKMYDKSSIGRQKLALVLYTISWRLSKKTGVITFLDGDPTIEHILPQTPNIDWKNSLGDNLSETYEYLHTIGNLTLVNKEWNSSLSNSAYHIKKSKLADHGLHLNSHYFSEKADEVWDDKAIKKRAGFLADQILEIWENFGELPSQPTYSGVPVTLTICGETLPVKSWRDVATQTAEKVIRVIPDFESLALRLPGYFKQQEQDTRYYRLLSNNWWLSINMSAHSIQRFCSTLLEEANISEDEFEIEVS